MSTDRTLTSPPRMEAATTGQASSARSVRPPAASEGEGAGGAALIARLLIWLSPTCPVGAYSYSHGLEWAVETGQVRDVETLAAWTEDLLVHGAGRCDVIFLAESWRALGSGDRRSLESVAELAAAHAPSAERQLETLAQGTAFLAAIRAAW